MNLDSVEWWHVALVLLAGGLWWRLSGAQGANALASYSDESIQMHVAPYGLPSDFMHWTPVSWAGRRHPYPAGIGENVGELCYTGPPDYADMDR